VMNSFGRSSHVISSDALPSAWARSTTPRMPDAEAECVFGAAPGEYYPTHAAKPSVAFGASAQASPSVQSQRGHSWHSASPQQRLSNLPNNQGAQRLETPGPGAYNATAADPRTAREPRWKGGLASTSFRSTTAQHDPGAGALANGPPPGAYDAELDRWAASMNSSKMKSGDLARTVFASKSERFPKDEQSTSVGVGPGTYSPDVGERGARERAPGGKAGAKSFPFSSTDRRSRKLLMEPGNIVYEDF
jgi:hypothetical protein